MMVSADGMCQTAHHRFSSACS